jgi:hypothetical protein
VHTIGAGTQPLQNQGRIGKTKYKEAKGVFFLKEFWFLAKMAIICRKIESNLAINLYSNFYIFGYTQKTKYINMEILVIFPPHFWQLKNSSK